MTFLPRLCKTCFNGRYLSSVGVSSFRALSWGTHFPQGYRDTTYSRFQGTSLRTAHLRNFSCYQGGFLDGNKGKVMGNNFYFYEGYGGRGAGGGGVLE